MPGPTSVMSSSRPTTPTSSPRRTRPSPAGHIGTFRPAPYMVALSGWPEPVYIDSHRIIGAGKAKSRSGTPRGSLSGPSGGGPAVQEGDQGGKSAQAVPREGALDVEMAIDPAAGADAAASSKATPTPYAPTRISNQDLYPYYHLAVTGRTSVDLGLGGTSASVRYQDSPARRAGDGNGRVPIDPALMDVAVSSAEPSSKEATKGSAKGIDTILYPYANCPQPVSPLLGYPTRPATDPAPRSAAAPRPSAFSDPRFTPRASVLDSPAGHMRLAPSWNNAGLSGTAPPTSHNQSYTSIRTSLPDPPSPTTPAEKGMPPPPVPSSASATRTRLQREATGVAPRSSPLGLFSERAQAQGQIMRSTPEVYPPPNRSRPETRGMGALPPMLNGIPGFNGPGEGAAGPGMAGWATEVYPRDPDSVLLWRQTAAAVGAGAGGQKEQTPPRQQRQEPQAVQGTPTYSYLASALSPPRAGGWSPTVPWRESSGSGSRSGSASVSGDEEAVRGGKARRRRKDAAGPEGMVVD